MSKKVKCPICGEKFTRKGLPSHFRSHPDEDYSEYKDDIESVKLEDSINSAESKRKKENNQEVRKWKKTPRKKALKKIEKLKAKARN